MKSYVTLALVLLVLAFPMKAEPKSEDKWINFSGHGMSFEYPAEWSLVDNPTGVVVGDKGIFGLSIVMHKEGCYPLSQHPQLLDFMIKLWSREMD